MSKTLFCQRCFHYWKTNKKTQEDTQPKYCPKCHSPNWQTPASSKNKITLQDQKNAAMAKALSKIQEALSEYQTSLSNVEQNPTAESKETKKENEPEDWTQEQPTSDAAARLRIELKTEQN